jgi:hypothetical protein
MSMTNYLETALLELLLNGESITGLADNAATSPLTELYLSLHTSDPGEGGSQSTNETTYTGYARVAVARTSSGWTVTGNVAALTSSKEFPVGTGGSGTVTHVGIGTSASGTGTLLLKGTVTPSLAVGAAVAPRLTTATTITFD